MSSCWLCSSPAACRLPLRRGRGPCDGAVLRPFVFGSDPYAAGQHRGIDVAGDLGTNVEAPASGRGLVRGHRPEGRQDAFDRDRRTGTRCRCSTSGRSACGRATRCPKAPRWPPWVRAGTPRPPSRTCTSGSGPPLTSRATSIRWPCCRHELRLIQPGRRLPHRLRCSPPRRRRLRRRRIRSRTRRPPSPLLPSRRSRSRRTVGGGSLQRACAESGTGSSGRSRREPGARSGVRRHPVLGGRRRGVRAGCHGAADAFVGAFVGGEARGIRTCGDCDASGCQTGRPASIFASAGQPRSRRHGPSGVRSAAPHARRPKP